MTDDSPAAAPETWPQIRPATAADIDAMVELHTHAFAAKFDAAFGRSYRARGAAALATTWHRQGPAALHGMLVATADERVIGTLTLRTAHHPSLPEGVAEQAFYQALGPWRGLRALFALSLLDHRIAPGEGFISDVAVAPDLRRRGVAAALLAAAEAEAARRRLRFLSLYVAAANQPALQLYTSRNFRRRNRRRSLLSWLFFGEGSWWYMTKDLV